MSAVNRTSRSTADVPRIPTRCRACTPGVDSGRPGTSRLSEQATSENPGLPPRIGGSPGFGLAALVPGVQLAAGVRCARSRSSIRDRGTAPTT